VLGSLENGWNTINPLSTSNVFYGIASSGGTGAAILGLNPFLPAAADFVGAAGACSSSAEAEGILAGIGWLALGAIDPEGDEAAIVAEDGLDGSFTTFARDADGNITSYTTYGRADPRDPADYRPTLRYDSTGRAHYNKATGEYVETPHVHDPKTPGGVRPPHPKEIP
jgi:hypothetical protein